MIITRLAPSPTGLIHLGNAWSFLLCWLMARHQGGMVILRIDDLDPQRSRQEFVDDIKRDLSWLGLDWDQEYSQSARYDIYATALAKLKGLTYPCFCTRKELRALASAPHPGDEGAPYPGICLNLSKEQQQALIAAGKPYALRLRCPEHVMQFTDLTFGCQSWQKADYGGDFALKRSDGVWAYQFASAIDDGEMGVNLIVRGRDLLPSTPRQIILADVLGYERSAYGHIGLLLDNQGERLAKRHKSLAIAALAEAGITPGQITGFLASLAGLNPAGLPLSPTDILANLAGFQLPAEDIALPERLPFP